MTPTRTRADNFVRHNIEQFRGDDIAWGLYCKRRKGVRELIDKLEAEFLAEIEEAKNRPEVPWLPPFLDREYQPRTCLGPIVHSEESGFDHMPLMTEAEMYPEEMPEGLTFSDRKIKFIPDNLEGVEIVDLSKDSNTNDLQT